MIAKEVPLLEAAKDLREDLKLRAEFAPDGVATVPVSHGVWLRFCAALEREEAKA